MKRSALRHVVIALILLVAFVSQGTWALAGTTGGLSGTVIDAQTQAPVAGAQVTVQSPSQTATASTDSSGRFTFLTLAPDTYTVNVSKNGYDSVSEPGSIVFADTVQTVTVRIAKLKTIAVTHTTAQSALVKTGTTADVYSVNAAGQTAAGALGGGGSLNSAYSAIATVPGAYVIPNQTGYYQTIVIRGGDFDQVGYEFDGVPVNRSFDNYPSSSASSLGNSEVQVYTGANPANSEGQGLAGYINQVIKTGTYPGYAEANLGIGTPAFYHQASAQVGGSTPDRNFSYYVGVGGYNQDFRYVDNDNGSSYDQWLGAPLTPDFTPFATGCNSHYVVCYAASQNNGFFPSFGPSGYLLGAFNYGLLASVAERDVVGNVHFGIPHKHDGGKDDVQLLWDSSYLLNSYYNTTNDIVNSTCPVGGVPCVTGTGASAGSRVAPSLGQPIYFGMYQLNCNSLVGQTFSPAGLNANAGCISSNNFPSSANGQTGVPIPANQRDTGTNNQEIVKLQYTKNFGSTAFLRLYGYSYYSSWILWGPQCAYADYICPTSPDYELSSHTRGLSLQYQNQINAQNLLGTTVSYTTANSIRDNNTQMFNAGGLRSRAAFVVNAADPYSGYCFNPVAGSAPTACGAASQHASWAQIQAGAVAPIVGPPTTTSGGATGNLPAVCKEPGVKSTTCTYLLAENSLYATYNNIVPRFFTASLTDEFRPSDRWLFNLGLRLDSFTFIGMDTTTGNISATAPYARQFWFNAFNLVNCIQPGNPQFFKGRLPGTACPAGYSPSNLLNTSGQNFTFNEWQPRIAGTYTVNPDNVLRFSFGRYTQAPNAAFEQYNQLAEDLPFALLGPTFYPYGRNQPGYPISPPTSLNYDVSWEHHFKGSDWSFKFTPFLRQTQNQIQQFFINQVTGFVSGLNTGSQRSQGVEFQLQKGDFSRNGLSGLVSFAYTNSYIKYGTLPNGTTVITPLNGYIGNYNSYTKACAPGGAMFGKSQYGQPLCATSGLAVPCYRATTTSTSGAIVGAAPAPCGSPGSYANPYFNAGGQSLIDPGQNFPTYSIFPGGLGSSGAAFGSPYVATMLLNYKHDKFTITPSLQFQGGGRYGYPTNTPGIDPASGCVPLKGSLRYDATTCQNTILIPNQYTGVFDSLGSFTQPNSIAMNLQLAYDVSPRLTLTGVLANIFNTCWGGTTAAWTVTDHNVCGYVANGAGLVNPVGNVYNPGDPIQGTVKYPYAPIFGPFNQNGNSTKTPFAFYLTAKIKI